MSKRAFLSTSPIEEVPFLSGSEGHIPATILSGSWHSLSDRVHSPAQDAR